jgi:hypothetical protein
MYRSFAKDCNFKLAASAVKLGAKSFGALITFISGQLKVPFILFCKS